MAGPPPQQVAMSHPTPVGAMDKATISHVAMIIKQEPGLGVPKKETLEQVHQKEILADSGSQKEQPKEPWAATEADHEDSPIEQQLSCEEALTERDQPPQRKLGQKFTPIQTDLGRYGPEPVSYTHLTLPTTPYV